MNVALGYSDTVEGSSDAHCALGAGESPDFPRPFLCAGPVCLAGVNSESSSILLLAAGSSPSSSGSLSAPRSLPWRRPYFGGPDPGMGILTPFLPTTDAQRSEERP